jgi:hypothetical protein
MENPMLPIQAKPVDRLQPIQPYMVEYIVGTNPDGTPMKLFVTPEADPFPDAHSYFRLPAAQRVALCPALSSYAICRCFQSGGRF